MNDRSLSATLSYIMTAFRPAISIWLFRRGYVANFGAAGKNMADLLYDRNKMTAFYNTLTSDIEKNDIEKLVNGIFALLGIDPNSVSAKDKRDFIATFLHHLAPTIYFSLGEEKYDEFFGRVGAPAVAAKGIIEAYADFGITGDQALTLANQFILEARSDPTLAKGFNAVELGQILKSAVKNSLIAPTANPQIFLRQARNLISYYASARDFFYRQNKKDVNIDTLTQFIVKTRSNYEGIPVEEAAFRFRRDLYVLSIAPHGLFQAGVLASGIQSPLAPETTRDLDKKLRENAVNSPAGNVAGATIRAVQEMGAGGPLYKLYKQIMSGNMPRVLPAHWIQLASRSGIPPGVAIAMLRQSSRNRSFITPEVIQTLRKAQFNYDVAPYLDRIMVAYANPELRRGALAQMAERLGYKNIGMMDAGQVMAFMHSPIINSNSMAILNYASDRARVEERHSGELREPLARRISEVLINPPKTPSGHLDLSRALPYLLGAKHMTELGDIMGIEKARSKLMPPRPGIKTDFTEKLPPQIVNPAVPNYERGDTYFPNKMLKFPLEVYK